LEQKTQKLSWMLQYQTVSQNNSNILIYNITLNGLHNPFFQKRVTFVKI